MPATKTLPRNRAAFLDMLAFSEIGRDLLAKSDNGYNVLVGGKLFSSYTDHPRVKVYERKDEFVRNGKKDYSTAAGRYQLLARYWDPNPRTGHPGYKKLLHLPNFGPLAQDAVALQMIAEQRALADIDAGRITAAIAKCRNIWASLPGAGYGQHEHPAERLVLAYRQSGGSVA